MTKLAPEWVRTNDPVIRRPARYRWTTAPAFLQNGEKEPTNIVPVAARDVDIDRNGLYQFLEEKDKYSICYKQGCEEFYTLAGKQI